MGYEIIEGSRKNFKDIAEINKVFFTRTRTVGEIEETIYLHPEFHLTLALKEKKAVGYGLGYKDEKNYYLWIFGVLPEHRKQGLGAKLLNAEINFAQKNGFEKFTVKTFNRWQSMLLLLIKRGFKIVDLKQKEAGEEPEIWLELDLKTT